MGRHLRWGKWEGGRSGPTLPSPQTHTMHPVEVVVLQPEAHVQHTLGQHEGLQDATHCGTVVRVPNAEGRRVRGGAQTFCKRGGSSASRGWDRENSHHARG